MEIDLEKIKELRKTTSVGIVECKNALIQCCGDVAKAVDYLREKGVSKAYKKLDRVANDGVVAIHLDGRTSSIIELNSETDFVSRNLDFQNFASDLAYYASKNKVKNSEQLLGIASDRGVLLKDELMHKISVIGEKISLSRADTISVDEGIVGGYVHNSIVKDVGKSASLVALSSNCSDPVLLKDFATQLAMHVVAMRPESLSIHSLDAEFLAKERSVIEKQVKDLGKSSLVSEKIIEGKLSKFYQDVVLLEQIFVMDESFKISELIRVKEKELGISINLVDYRLFSIAS